VRVQVCDTFPILDFLNVMSSLPQIFNPYSILRLSKKVRDDKGANLCI
jgi:hypothetical protein